MPASIAQPVDTCSEFLFQLLDNDIVTGCLFSADKHGTLNHPYRPFVSASFQGQRFDANSGKRRLLGYADIAQGLWFLRPQPISQSPVFPRTTDVRAPQPCPTSCVVKKWLFWDRSIQHGLDYLHIALPPTRNRDSQL